mgnify:CR=1 FL=1|jgi:hypothetical protein
MATRQTLAGAIRVAASLAYGNDTSTESSNKNYGSSRVSQGVGPSITRTAQSTGNITTAPNFYSPFLTPSAFQIPNARREVYLWANWWKNNEPKVSAAINFYANFPFAGWKLECSSTYVKDYFEKMVDKLNFQKWLPEISKVYHLLGDSFVLLSIDCPHCHGSNWDEEKQETCNHDGASWKSISILNPDSVMKTPGMIDQPGMYVYRPSADEMKIVNERQPKEIYDSIPDNVKKMILKGDPIKLNPISIHHFKHGSNPWEDYGTSMVRSLFPVLTYKDKIRQAQFIIAERMVLPVKVVKVGNNERPASQEDIDSVQEELAAIANDPNLTLVTHHAFEFEYIGAGTQIFAVANEFEGINKEIMDGLMLNSALLNGEGPNYASAQVGLLALSQRLDTFRREVARWIEQCIFKPVAEWNGFIVEGDRGQDEIVYPKISFEDLQLRDNTGLLQNLVQANTNGVVSNTTLIEAFGFDPDQEIERLRYEQGANFMNESNFGNNQFSLEFSSGPVSGQGFGAQQPATPGEMAPGGIPPTAPGMAPMAEDKDQNYRLASSIINEIYQEKINLYHDQNNIRTASKRIKSAAHEGFLMSMSPVTGRGTLGPLPEEYDGFYGTINTPIFGGYESIALNYEAEKEIFAAENSEYDALRQVVAKIKERPQAKMFTSLEKLLYGLLLSINMPFPLYAQYAAGPSMDYQLDSAIPSLKIGFEADGEIWHNNVDKIAKDKRRDTELAANGWIILRFTDRELKDHPQDCLNVILKAMKKRSGISSQGKTFL